MNTAGTLFAAILMLTACGGGTSNPPGPVGDIRLERVFVDLPPLGAVLALLQAPGDESTWYAVIQDGRVLSFANTPNVAQVSTFLDLRSLVAAGGEMGLLGMAFHPQYTSNGQLYVYYTADTPRRSVIARFVFTQGAWQETVLLEVAQPDTNHNGGNLAFGPDGNLYVGLGDGGGAGDPNGHAQNTTSLLGAMLRINVDGAAPYAIPAGNPFIGSPLCNNPAIVFNSHNCPEIFAWGLRNPWRWSFDRVSGWLWAGDVGQARVEEVDIIQSGNNYGWDVMEGDVCYDAVSCDTTGLTLPVAVYNRTQGRSIVGGYVYRGQDADLQRILQDTYLYADTYTTRIWGLSPSGTGYQQRELIDTDLQFIYSFAEDNRGELYVLDPAFSRNLPGYNIYKVIAAQPLQ